MRQLDQQRRRLYGVKAEIAADALKAAALMLADSVLAAAKIKADAIVAADKIKADASKE